jgi:hypothetical protein
MIGVIAGKLELVFVEEFFELFKTPWEHCRVDRRYPVVVSAEPSAPVPECSLAIIYGTGPGGPEDRTGRSLEPCVHGRTLNYNGRLFPVYGGCLSFAACGTSTITCEEDDGTVGFSMSGRSSTTFRIGFDLFREIRFLLSNGQPGEQAEIPTLDIHIATLRDLIVRSGLPLAEVPPIPPGHDFILCLTHDVDFAGIRFHRVDRTVLGFLYRATVYSFVMFLMGRLALTRLLRNLVAAASLPLVLAGWARDFFNDFEHYLRLEGGNKSTFFLVPFKDVDGHGADGSASTGRATRYDVDDIEKEIAFLMARGCELGLHGINAWYSEEEAEKERARIRQATGTEISGVRMHWLYFSADSPRRLESAGFSYDSTWGFNDRVGFRGGTAQAFRPVGVERLLEIPLIIMDSALFSRGRMRLLQDEGIRLITTIASKVREIGGVLMVNWHTRSLAPERQWDAPYMHILRLAESGHAWAATAGEVADWFSMRRSARFSEIDVGRSRIAVPALADRSVPGLRLRLYNAAPDGTMGFKETAFSDSMEFYDERVMM